ncbi:MAG: hypothetical protein KDE14_01260 [Rhodobacteraceae bacterium]|nr:hypothetical protein [Paracoccaceae bacterium]
MARAKKKTKAKNKAKTKVKAKAKSGAKAKKAPAKKKSAAKKAKPRARPPETMETLTVPADLDARLSALAEQMEMTFDALLLQALCEFADAWEDHFRTVAALAEDDDRVQLSVKLD